MKREINFTAVERVGVGAIFWKYNRLVGEAQRDYEANLLAILRERGLEAIPPRAALVPGDSGFRGLVWDDGAPEPAAPRPAPAAAPVPAASGSGAAKETTST